MNLCKEHGAFGLMGKVMKMQDEYGIYTEFTFGEITQRMRWIEPGNFMMGSPENEPGRCGKSDGSWNEGPQHEVRLTRGFWLFDTPVTQALWTAVMGDNPSRFKDNPEHPVERVSWDVAMRFIKRLSGIIPDLDLVLPTEAQWEYACRAGTTTPNYAGSENELTKIAWFFSSSGGETRPVATKQCNPWGLYDMLGNVWEWCADDRRNYRAEAVTDPVGSLVGAQRALRGGSWFNSPRLLRSAFRFGYLSDYRSPDIGFRCAQAEFRKEIK